MIEYILFRYFVTISANIFKGVLLLKKLENASERALNRYSRQSNFELLRIIAIFGIIVQHYSNPGIGGGLRYMSPGSPNQILMGLLHVTMICAVNVFVLISGYFMRDSKKADLLKPIELLVYSIIDI